MHAQVVEKAPALQSMMTSLYKCNYKEFFVALVDVVDQLHLDPYLAPHTRYFLRQVPPFLVFTSRVPADVALFEPNRPTQQHTPPARGESVGARGDFSQRYP